MDKQPLTLENLQSDLDQLKKAMDFQKEIASLRTEVTLQLSHFKWVAWTAGVCLAILGFLGFKAWSDLTGSAKVLLEKQLSELSDRYSNLSRGFSLVDNGRSQDAIPYLMPLYEANHYDEPVVRALLYALNDVADCGAAKNLIDEMRKDNKRFFGLRNPMVFNGVAVILRDCAGDNPTSLDDARDLLELTLKRMPADSTERRYPYYNLFIYYFIKGDMQRAEDYLKQASSVLEGYPFDESPVKDPWMRRLIQTRPTANNELESMWSRAKKQKQ